MKFLLDMGISIQRALRLEQALDDLTVTHREVILLWHYEELGFREIEERMGCSADAARMLLACAMAKLTVKMRADPQETRRST